MELSLPLVAGLLHADENMFPSVEEVLVLSSWSLTVSVLGGGICASAYISEGGLVNLDDVIEKIQDGVMWQILVASSGLFVPQIMRLARVRQSGLHENLTQMANLHLAIEVEGTDPNGETENTGDD